MKYIKYMLADKGYDSSLIRNKLNDMGIIPLIAFNKRNTKNTTKIKNMTDKEKII